MRPLVTRLRVLYSVSGAAAFVAALIYFAHFYLTLGPAASATPVLPALVANVTVFGIFSLHHSAMARSGAKRWLTQYIPPDLERTTYVWVASLLFAATCVLWRELPGTIYQATGLLRATGFGLQAGGLAIIASSVAVLDPRELAGLRPDSTAGALRARGPYRWVRHPIYLGWTLIVFGAPDMWASRLAFALISTTYLVIAIPWEESSMAEALGLEYRRYQDLVRWRLIPGLW